MPQILQYDRAAAVTYAHTWAYRRNPDYFDFSGIGGDCTNFASQCIYAGAHLQLPAVSSPFGRRNSLFQR